MGGDIASSCASVLSGGRIASLYIVNLIGSTVSAISCLLTIFTFVYRVKKGLALSNPPSNRGHLHVYLESKQPLLSKIDRPDSNRLSYDSFDSFPAAAEDLQHQQQQVEGEQSCSCAPTSTVSVDDHYGNANQDTTTPSSPRPKTINRLIFFLTLSDFIGCSSIVFTQVCMLADFHFATTIHFCIALRCVIHFGFLSSFLWTNCIAFYLLREVYEWKPQRFPFYIFHIVCWGIPLISITIFASGHFIVKADQIGWCTITPKFQFFFWVLPLVISVLWNLLCYVLIYKKFNQILSFGVFGSKSHQLKRHVSKKLTLYLAAFLVCWLPDLINHTIFYVGACPPFVMWVLQDLFSPLQGFLNFVVYVLTYRIVTVPWKRNTNANRLSC
ncbi:cAMP receptor-like protein [Cavenderia fasciculata]|uniref:cAMP receptor-like protein n=1 Tax=Cavenderia fasciculata TaxID=261658 RepID=F4Q3K8_CACFS|nr:cAMP receptor-like protein [Cavenderia fasciculata]EGG17666.1 cAMP receptor-like protein [Cavenderia fasciculata]|eukprot:XP_004356150.1 cAMP receptor-like protein [Cavenderia fasciculata]